MSVAEILGEITRMNTPLIEITGGEPLIQKETPALVDAIVKKFAIDIAASVKPFMPSGEKRLLIETSGSVSIKGLNPNAVIIMDIKTPSSGSAPFNLYDNISFLKPFDEVKFVIGSREDYFFCLDVIKRFNLDKKCGVLLSPVFGKIDPEEIVSWMMNDSIAARFQLQLHKHIWRPDARGV